MTMTKVSDAGRLEQDSNAVQAANIASRRRNLKFEI
jgi:hypothetical protein